MKILSLDLFVVLRNLHDFPLHTEVYLRFKICDPVKILSLDVFVFLRILKDVPLHTEVYLRLKICDPEFFLNRTRKNPQPRFPRFLAYFE